MTSSSANYTIVFTDSGLGGLSIMADFYNSVKSKAININTLNIIFFNALQESGHGYNSMSTVEQKTHTFNAALETMVKRYQPDRIAIACNTLSAIYPRTPFANKYRHTLEIISCGRSLLTNHLNHYPEIPLFIFATPTTLQTRAYAMEKANVYYISGDNLASLIEFEYRRPELKNKVGEMFSKIKNHLGDQKNFALFLGCTHYTYISYLFRQVSREFELNLAHLIDPAESFNQHLLEVLPGMSVNPSPTMINLKIESQAQILQEEIESISGLLQNKSGKIAQLLTNYTRLPKTF